MYFYIIWMNGMLVGEKYRMGFLIDKANEGLGTAERLMEGRRYEEAVLSCYHTVFFMVKAMLMKSSISIAKNSDSIPIFYSSYVANRTVSENCFCDIQYVLMINGFLEGFVTRQIDDSIASTVFACAERVYDELIELLS